MSSKSSVSTYVKTTAVSLSTVLALALTLQSLHIHAYTSTVTSSSRTLRSITTKNGISNHSGSSRNRRPFQHDSQLLTYIPSTIPASRNRSSLLPQLVPSFQPKTTTSLFSSTSGDLNDDTTPPSEQTETDNSEVTTDTNKKSFLSNLKSKMPFLKSKKDDGSDGDALSTTQKLAKMGLSVLLTYGFVSNVSASIFFSLAWFSFSAKTGLSPLAPNQWKAFTVVYAGFYVLSNFFRPVRITISIALGKYFENALVWIQTKFNVSKKVAIGILIFGANVVGSCTVFSLGVGLASLFSGVPIFPAK